VPDEKDEQMTSSDDLRKIPTIEPYEMPKVADLPANVASWEIDPKRAVLLIHDMQKYFLAALPRGTSPTTELLANVVRLREQCRAVGVPVTYTAQPGGMSEGDRGLLRDLWGPGMAADSRHREIIDPLRPEAGDRVFTKWRYSAFHRNDLLPFLRLEGRDQIVLCGVYAHVGVMISACEAFTNDIETFLVGDAVADFTAWHHRIALEWSALRCAVVCTTDSVVDRLSANEAAEGSAA
jgi:isochorismate hydrolase